MLTGVKLIRCGMTAGLIATMIAGVAMAQTGGGQTGAAPPPVTKTVPEPAAQPTTPGAGGVRVLTLAEKEELRKLCSQAAYKRAAKCAGFAPKTAPLPPTQ